MCFHILSTLDQLMLDSNADPTRWHHDHGRSRNVLACRCARRYIASNENQPRRARSPDRIGHARVALAGARSQAMAAFFRNGWPGSAEHAK